MDGLSCKHIRELLCVWTSSVSKFAMFIPVTTNSVRARLGLALDKCRVYSEGTTAGSEAACEQALGITHARHGLVAGGVLIGQDAWVEVFVLRRSEVTIDLIDDLMQLLLPMQNKLLLLRTSLQQRLAHLARVVPWTQLEARTAELESRIAAAAFDPAAVFFPSPVFPVARFT
jgi:hypothetical protein